MRGVALAVSAAFAHVNAQRIYLFFGIIWKSEPFNPKSEPKKKITNVPEAEPAAAKVRAEAAIFIFIIKINY